MLRARSPWRWLAAGAPWLSSARGARLCGAPGLPAVADTGACEGVQERAGGGEGGALSVVERARLDRLRIVAEAEAREKAEAAALAEQVREPAVRLCAVPGQPCALASCHLCTQHSVVTMASAADGAAPGAGAGAAAAAAGHAAARAGQAGAPKHLSTCSCSGLSSWGAHAQAGTPRRCGCASRASGCARRVSHAARPLSQTSSHVHQDALAARQPLSATHKKTPGARWRAQAWDPDGGRMRLTPADPDTAERLSQRCAPLLMAWQGLPRLGRLLAFSPLARGSPRVQLIGRVRSPAGRWSLQSCARRLRERDARPLTLLRTVTCA